MTELERLVREWRDAQHAIDRIPLHQRRSGGLEPVERLVNAHNALLQYANERLGQSQH
jgi:hypothetical protein